MKKLESFVNAPKLFGYVTHLWYAHLRARYPYQFIKLSQQRENLVLGHKYWVEECIKSVNRMYDLLNDFLINPPETEERTKHFDFIVNTLEEVLLKQNSLN